MKKNIIIIIAISCNTFNDNVINVNIFVFMYNAKPPNMKFAHLPSYYVVET